MRKLRIVIASLIAILVFGAGMWFRSRLRTPLGEAAFDLNAAQKLADAVIRGTLKPDSHGLVDVPIQSGFTTVDNIVTVTHGNNDLIMVYFPTRAYRFGARGYIYCNREITRQDWTGVTDGQPSVRIRSEYNQGLAPTAEEKYRFAKLPLTRRINDHWWRVEESDRSP